MKPRSPLRPNFPVVLTRFVKIACCKVACRSPKSSSLNLNMPWNSAAENRNTQGKLHTPGGFSSLSMASTIRCIRSGLTSPAVLGDVDDKCFFDGLDPAMSSSRYVRACDSEPCHSRYSPRMAHLRSIRKRSGTCSLFRNALWHRVHSGRPESKFRNTRLRVTTADDDRVMDSILRPSIRIFELLGGYPLQSNNYKHSSQ